MLDRARQIADDVLFPAALAVDRADRVPASHLDLLAAQGFYGVAAPAELGGVGVEDFATMAALLETLAGGCLTTAFVWLQHHGAVRGAAFSAIPGVREQWVPPLAAGRLRGGIGLAGVRPGTQPLAVREVDGGYLLDGEIPWVTGWGMIDVVHVAACSADHTVHFMLVDTGGDTGGDTGVETGGLTATPVEMVAAQASRTVTVRFTEHFVAADRLTGTRPYDEWVRSEASGWALNGFLALGVASRCRRLLGAVYADTDSLDAELATCRAALLNAAAEPAGEDAVPTARAAASALAMRAATQLMVYSGSRAVLREHHAQRLVREAAFLLVFATRRPIRDALIDRLR